MTSSTSAPAEFNGVGGGKVKHFKSSSPAQSSHPVLKSVLWRAAGVLGFVGMVAGIVVAVFFGNDKSVYDFSSNDYVAYTAGGMNSLFTTGFVVTLICLVVLLVTKHSKVAVMAMGIIVITVPASLPALYSAPLGDDKDKAAFQSWMMDNEGLAPDKDSPLTENFSVFSVKSGAVIPLLNKEGESVRGLFTKSGDGKYVFSQLAPAGE